MGGAVPCTVGLEPWILDKIDLAFGTLTVGTELRLWGGCHPL